MLRSLPRLESNQAPADGTSSGKAAAGRDSANKENGVDVGTACLSVLADWVPESDNADARKGTVILAVLAVVLAYRMPA